MSKVFEPLIKLLPRSIFILGCRRCYRMGDRFFIEDGEEHSAHVMKGYKAIAVFFQPDRIS